MRSPIANFIRSNRMIFAVTMLCFLALKGLGFLGMASTIGRNPDAPSSFALAVVGAHCDNRHDSGAPQDSHAHHTQCCIICTGVARLAILEDPASISMVIAFLTPRAESRPAKITFTLHDPLLSFSSGLFSDWSPTAPPAA